MPVRSSGDEAIWGSPQERERARYVLDTEEANLYIYATGTEKASASRSAGGGVGERVKKITVLSYTALIRLDQSLLRNLRIDVKHQKVNRF